MSRKAELIWWSLAIPGFGQLLNGKLLKGTLFIAMEFAININAHLNHIIMLSFQGRIAESIRTANIQWLMFYPCVFMFAIWDAYRDAGGGTVRFAYLPFVLPAFLGTIGIIYSPVASVLGPVWLPMILGVAGVALGLVVKALARSL